MKTIKTHTIILFLITLTIGLAAASCDQPTGDQMQAQEEEPAAEAATSYDAMARFPGFDIKDRTCPKPALDMFLKVEGVDGEATDDQHEDWIVILSVDGGWSFRATSSHSGRGKGRANVRARPFVITKPVDRASPALRRHADTGEPIAEGVFVLRRTCDDQQEFFEIELQDVLITSYQSSGSSGGSSQRIPTESISFSYSKIALLLPAVQKVRNANR